MVHTINNILDILWLVIGLIAVLVLMALLVPWISLLEAFLLVVVMIWIAIKFWLREGWHGIKRLLRKKRRWIHIDEHDLFI